MRIYCVMILLAAACGQALADPHKVPAKSAEAPSLRDASGRFALQPSLLQTPSEAVSGDGRFALRVDLHQKQAPLPSNDRYTLSSRLGAAALGTCNGQAPDLIFRNGFEN